MPTTSNGRDWPSGGLGSSSNWVLPALPSSDVSRDSRSRLLAFTTRRYQSIMSLSSFTCKSVTLPPGRSAFTFRLLSTLRRVTGSSANVLVPGSANRSTTPKLAAANLASGGWPAVFVFKGKLSALRSVRFEASTKPLGSSSVKSLSSGNGPLKLMLLTVESPSLSLSTTGLKVSLPDRSTMPCAILLVTGALKRRPMGKMGMHAASEFSRSQLKLALNGSRTW